jgi:hypothetical protein
MIHENVRILHVYRAGRGASWRGVTGRWGQVGPGARSALVAGQQALGQLLAGLKRSVGDGGGDDDVLPESSRAMGSLQHFRQRSSSSLKTSLRPRSRRRSRTASKRASPPWQRVQMVSVGRLMGVS